MFAAPDVQGCLQVDMTSRAAPAGAFYMRLVGRPIEVYQYLEPLYNDYRKIRLRAAGAGHSS